MLLGFYALPDAVADALLDVLAEEVLGDLVDEVEVPDPPEAHHRQDVVVVELGADPLQERFVLLRFQDEILRKKDENRVSRKMLFWNSVGRMSNQEVIFLTYSPSPSPFVRKFGGIP